ncbi:MAG TPA: potassium-transporting ATPase subunit KdpA [Gemmataceae bacterium]|nr:potassium-transporting ATPase subunit KdpA [Gemmataceae bacterium]
MWTLPLLIILILVALSLPLGGHMTRILDRDGTANAVERAVDTGPQTWKQYAVSMLIFNVAVWLVGFVVLASQPYHPTFLNPDGKGMLSPSTIFNTCSSFLSNTNLQHYPGEVHLSYGSQLFGILWNQFVSPAIGLAALLAIVRALRGDRLLGNFYLDLWRSVVYLFLPLSLVVGLLLLAGGMPMTLAGAAKVAGLEGAEQSIARGPVAAVVAIKQLGTNGGGFFGANSAHPFENPNAFTNLVECVSILLVPMAAVVMFGRMIRNRRHAAVIYAVSLLLLVGLTGWAVATDTGRPNPGLTDRPALNDLQVAGFDKDGNPVTKEVPAPALVGLPVGQPHGNLEGKELRFGPSAGATWAAMTTCTSNGSANCSHDSLNPLAGLTPLTGMWLNCIFGGVGVGLINLLVYLVVGVFLAGLMVGRTPEYLGKKIEAREMKLAMLALLIHPLMVLGPTGLFAATDWAEKSANNPAAHGLSETLYEFSSASANNGSEFGGLGQTFGFNDAKANPSPPAPFAVHYDIGAGLVMLLSRFVPIIAPLALAASLAAKKPTPFTSGTMRTDTVTFGFVLLGTILLVGALLFLPAAALGPIADHLGPLPFGN